jgi:pimeloyl-ACP methyl ester carboxylesterase
MPLMPSTTTPVVCLHASAASGKQWRRLVSDGGPGWQWHTPDLFGHGGRPGWPELDDTQRQRLADVMPSVRRHFEALFAAQWSDSLLGLLHMPVQLICGTATRASARRVAQSLAVRLPSARLRWLESAGHMAPMTDAARVNALLLESLGAQQGTTVT